MGLLAEDGTGDTGEPYICGYTGSGIYFRFTDETWVGAHTVSVKGFASVHHPLPYKYAPAKYAYEADLAEGAIPFEEAMEMSKALSAGARVTVKLNSVTYSVLDLYLDAIQLEHDLLIANPYKIVHVTWETGPDEDVLYTSELNLAAGEIIIPSSTANSAKKFRITVDDTGAVTGTEVVT